MVEIALKLKIFLMADTVYIIEENFSDEKEGSDQIAENFQNSLGLETHLRYSSVCPAKNITTKWNVQTECNWQSRENNR